MISFMLFGAACAAFTGTAAFAAMDGQADAVGVMVGFAVISAFAAVAFYGKD